MRKFWRKFRDRYIREHTPIPLNVINNFFYFHSWQRKEYTRYENLSDFYWGRFYVTRDKINKRAIELESKGHLYLKIYCCSPCLFPPNWYRVGRLMNELRELKIIKSRTRGLLDKMRKLINDNG